MHVSLRQGNVPDSLELLGPTVNLEPFNHHIASTMYNDLDERWLRDVRKHLSSWLVEYRGGRNTTYKIATEDHRQ